MKNTPNVYNNILLRIILMMRLRELLYSLLRNLIAPVKPKAKAYKDLCKILIDHLNPKPVVIAERYKFYERKQKDGESISEFIAGLRKLSPRCEFNTFLEEALRDRLVCGIGDSKISKRFLVEEALTLKKSY